MMKNNMKKFKKGKYHDSEDGIALIFALGFLSVLLLVGLAFATSALLERKLAINNRSAVQGKLLADSAASHVMGSLQSSFMNNYDKSGTIEEVPQKYISSSAGFVKITDAGAPDNIKDRPLMMSVSLDDSNIPQKVINPDTDADTAKLIKKELREQLQERIVDPSSTANKIDLLVWNDAESSPSATAVAATIEDWLNWTNIIEKGATNSDPNTITGRYAYIIEDITGKLNINDVTENKVKKTAFDASRLPNAIGLSALETGIISYTDIKDGSVTIGNFYGTDDNIFNKFYTSTNQLFSAPNIATWDKEKVELANSIFSPAITKEPEIFLRPDTDPTQKGEYHHKTLVDKVTLETLRDKFETSPTDLALNIEPYTDADTGSKSSTGIEFFRTFGTLITGSVFNRAGFPTETDRLNQIAANFFDFFDEDFTPTCDIEPITSDDGTGGTINFTSAAPTFLGNEKVPQINEITVGINGSISIVNKPDPELDTVSFAMNIFPAVEFTNIYDADLLKEYKLYLNVEIKAKKVINGSDVNDETLTLDATFYSNDFNLNSISENDFYVFSKDFTADSSDPFAPKSTSASDSKLNIASAEIKVTGIIIKSCFLALADGTYTVVDYVNTSEPLTTVSTIATYGGSNKTHVFPLEVKDPRANLTTANWEWDTSKIPIKSDLEGLNFKWDNINTLGENNFNANLDNLYDPNENNDYKTDIAKDFETVDSFARLRHYFPNKLENSYDLAAIGNISRAKAFQTLNVSKFNKNGYIGNYSDGDANILQHLKFSDKITSINSKFNYKSANIASLQAILLEAFKTVPDAFKDYTGNDISVDINDSIAKIKTNREFTNYKNFDTSNNRFKDLMMTTGAVGTDPEIYNYYGFKDIDLITAGIKESCNSLTNIGQQQVEFLTSAIIAKSSPRYFYYQVNMVGQSITDLETGKDEIDHIIDIGEKLEPSDSSTVYTLKSNQGKYDPYVDVINSTDKVKVIIRWDNKDKKFEVISYKKLEL